MDDMSSSSNASGGGMNMGGSGNSMGGMNMGYQVDYDNLTDEEIHKMNAGLFMRTLPGRSGNLLGHVIPAVFFISFATYLLIVSLKRARSLQPGQSFAELYIPETDPLLLRRFGKIIMVATVLGITFETTGGVLDMGNPFFQLAHQTLYFGYFVTAFCAYMESYGRLPWDTYRGALAVCLIASYLMWYSHGTMKKLMADQTLHILLGYINLVNALVVIYSMRFQDSVIAYISVWIMMILQGFWLIIAGLYESAFDLPNHEIATYLAVLSLLVVLTVAIVYVTFGPGPEPQNNVEFRRDFAPLKKTEDYDNDDDDAC